MSKNAGLARITLPAWSKTSTALGVIESSSSSILFYSRSRRNDYSSIPEIPPQKADEQSRHDQDLYPHDLPQGPMEEQDTKDLCQSRDDSEAGFPADPKR